MRKLIVFVCVIFTTLAGAQVSWKVDSVALWHDVNLPLNGANNTYNEIWGFTMKGREYGVIGSRIGTYIVDVTSIKNPQLVRYIPGAYNDATNRDYHDFNGYLYMVCDQGPSTLQIADLHYLPDSVPLVYDSDSLIIRCHNIFIDTTTKRLYACGVSIPDTVKERRVDLQIYDLSNGYLPELLLTYYDENIEQFHDIFVKNDTAFGNNGNTGLFFYDFSDLSDTLIMGSVLDYPEKGYNHAGYATEDGKYYYFSDETHGRGLKALRVDNFKDPEVVAIFSAGRNEKETVAHNLLVRGNLLFVSYYHEGLQVYDISKPSKPIRIGHYQTFTTQIQPNPNYPPSKDYGGYSGAWGVYPYLPSGFILVSDREKGMFIFDISDIDGKRHPELLPSKFIFPNPAGNYIDLVYPTKDIVEVELYDVNGKLVEQSTNFKEQDRVTRIEFRQAVQQGLYILKVKTRNGSFTEKLLRE